MAISPPPQRPAPLLTAEGGRSVIEALIVVIFVLIVLLTAASRYSSSIKTVQETALTIELSNLRSAVNFYAVVKGKLPASLKDLLKENVVLPKRGIEGRDYEVVISGRYVEGMDEDKEGYPLDPFGSRYSYDAKTGVIRSATKGYESW